MLETIIQQAAHRGMGQQARRFVGLLAESLVNQRTGGFEGFRKRFEDAGLGDLFRSWIGGNSVDKPLHPDQFGAGIGLNESNRLASLLGVSSGAVNMAGAEALPNLVALLTRDGKEPSHLTAPLAALLQDEAAKPRRKGLGWLFWLLLAGLLALFVLAVSHCQPESRPPMQPLPQPSEPVAPSQAQGDKPVAQEEAVQEPVEEHPAQFQLSNQDGQITVNGQLPADADKQRLMDALHAQFGADKISGDIVVDPQTLPADWLDKLIAALPKLGASGLKLGFDGDKLSIDTSALPEDQRFLLSQQLRELFSGYSMSGLWERASAALADLKSGFSAQDLVQALNLMNVYFDSNSNAITSDSADILGRAAQAISAAPQGTKIEVGGHSDSVGTHEGNLAMSQKRADAVVAKLVELGVSPALLTAKGYGASKPIADNATEEGRARNRRIEFTVLGE
ncbi:outer membrane protein OmpA-like peptidoglycan-associated protein/uncharacterized protein YidB (DUF937 family) [Pseudomonas nitritireducens]|uniref:Outer membrane protein OmpA-like peptidoglycan-associated protein/uncharacterized protein YidB (DUF937 family) n=1 Tax=Pseudomonas nitroreducens TaxID=46680 RepID=A0A7W7P4D9_PSENT|nr:OmpA family protein [Pseudomonas nitritireducens]MBB4866779.1 outer membrane protein OmpA-like peptidoglycan-associated protein/uncharacterized protein YidB (DUF937 family) [Pseudomonas nitritireducens]